MYMENPVIICFCNNLYIIMSDHAVDHAVVVNTMFDYSFFELYYTRHDILMGMKSINRKTYSDAKKKKLYMTRENVNEASFQRKLRYQSNIFAF